MDALPTWIIEFVRSELAPTLVALAVVAGREPLTWGVLSALTVGVWLVQRRA
jgi:hypothetical protein